MPELLTLCGVKQQLRDCAAVEAAVRLKAARASGARPEVIELLEADSSLASLRARQGADLPATSPLYPWATSDVCA